MSIYLLHGAFDCMAYEIPDRALHDRIFPERFKIPPREEWPLPMVPSFGMAADQPTRLADVHMVMANARLFSARAVDVMGLADHGTLIPVELADREDGQFHYFWSTRVVDCLDQERTTWIQPGLLRNAVFDDSRLGDAELFTVPEDQRFQFSLFLRESMLAKIKKARLKGFLVKRGDPDPKPWKS